MIRSEEVSLDPDGPNVPSADRAISDPAEDRFGYAAFAEHLSATICKMGPSEGFVIAIHGAWGSGKTTLLNFVLAYLRRVHPKKRPIEVHFNPWWFSGREDLTRRFFEQFEAVIARETILDGRRLRKLLAALSRAVSTSDGLLSRLRAALSPKWKNVAALKQAIARLLEEQDRRFLFVIDDIDRLTAEEIRQLFRLVKAVGDFPNVTYLLAFDRVIVAKVLSEAHRLPGEAYLEKIVQAPFELPLPNRQALHALVSERLNMILAGTPEDLFDRTLWNDLYWRGIEYFVRTPRDAIRFTNAISVTYPAVKGEVNFVDFIAIEILRIFAPVVYDIVRKNPDFFAEPESLNELDATRRRKEEIFHDGWLEQIPAADRGPARELLKRIYPRLQWVWGAAAFDEAARAAWRKARRACSRETFPIYFRMAVPEGDISNAEMTAFLASAHDRELFGNILKSLTGPTGQTSPTFPARRSRVAAFLERLGDFADERIPKEHVAPIIGAFLNAGDALLEREQEAADVFGQRNDRAMLQVISKLLNRLDEPERAAVLKSAVAEGAAVGTTVLVVTALALPHSKGRGKRDEEQLIPREAVDELERLAVAKVREGARNGSLLENPLLRLTLARWKDWTGKDEVKAWLADATRDDRGLIAFLQGFIRVVYSSTSPDNRKHRLDPKLLAPFIPISDIVRRLNALDESAGLTPEEEAAIEAFREEAASKGKKGQEHPAAQEE